MNGIASLAKRAVAHPRLARAFAHGVSCLLYHRVVPDDCYEEGFHPSKGLTVRRSDFEAQMRFVAEHFDPISLPEAVRRLQEGSVSARSVVVTFDDGYQDNLGIALPILRRCGIPATIYVTTGGPDGEPFLWWYELETMMGGLAEGTVRIAGRRFSWRSSSQRLACFDELNEIMKVSRPEAQRELLDQLRDAGAESGLDHGRLMLSWDEVRELDADPLITIGCHTTSHHSMAQLTLDELTRDLAASKARLEDQLGHAVEHFAYPYGARPEASEREFQAVRSAGFASAVTTRFGHWMKAHKQHPYALPRVTVTRFDSLEEFKLKVFGVRATLGYKGWRSITD